MENIKYRIASIYPLHVNTYSGPPCTYKVAYAAAIEVMRLDVNILSVLIWSIDTSIVIKRKWAK